MEKYNIEIGEDPNHVAHLLEDELYKLNSEKINQYDGELFSRVVRNNRKEIIAGIAGWKWAGICEITQFWVRAESRNNGIGKMLLDAAEAEARSKGCSTILVRSYSFQAPHYYEKHGYKTQFLLEDFPKGYSYYILTKELR